jgi:butyryl-CoA dehydrogenase
LDVEIQRIQQVVAHLVKFASTDIDRFLSDATVFMEQLSYVVIGWQWLKMASVAARRIDAGDHSLQSKACYEGKVHTMKFFFRYELPHAEACANTLMDPEYLTNLGQLDALS